MPAPPSGTNWDAYSHEQLHRMLWEDADIGDVSGVAAEWGRQSTALTGFADALRGQGAALRSNWQGRAAPGFVRGPRLLQLERDQPRDGRAFVIVLVHVQRGDERATHHRDYQRAPKPEKDLGEQRLHSATASSGPRLNW